MKIESSAPLSLTGMIGALAATRINLVELEQVLCWNTMAEGVTAFGTSVRDVYRVVSSITSEFKGFHLSQFCFGPTVLQCRQQRGTARLTRLKF